MATPTNTSNTQYIGPDTTLDKDSTKVGDIRQTYDRKIAHMYVYEVWNGEQWIAVADQAQAKIDYDNQTFNQSIAKAQQEAGLEPVGGTSLDGGSLRYPSDIAVSDKSHYVLFDFKKYNPPFSPAGGYTTTTNTQGTTRVDDYSLKSYNQSSNMMTPSGAPQIMLYMPEGIAASYKTNWDGKAFGNAVAGILRSAGDTANGEYLAAVKQAGNKFKEQWEKLPATAGAIAIQQAAKAITGDAIGIQDVFSSIGGGILNPNVELIFGGHDLRTLTLSFLMIPYNRREAETIEKIVTTFKKSMLPSFNGQAQDFWESENAGIGANRRWKNELANQTAFISNPDLVKVTFMQGSSVNNKISQFKTMSITDFDVNYTPDGVYAVGPDGYPVATKIQVNLMETKLVYAEDISAGY
tara:strand:- start:308 stop:1534 length:1227 start_codon:yes stop_codon:yes gene_type:complete